MQLSDLDLNQVYTYADYLKWQFEERVELIKGKIFKMSPAPNRKHRDLSGELFGTLRDFLKRRPCRVYIAPFDVRLPRKLTDDREIITVVQPDVCVICDRSKLDDDGCLGTPDIVVEVLSPGNNSKELRDKFELYEESGVKEYWVVSPENEYVVINTLSNGRYQAGRPLTAGDLLTSTTLPGFELDLGAFFQVGRI